MTIARWGMDRPPRSLFHAEPETPADDTSKFLSREACHAVENRIFEMTSGGGNTFVTIDSVWSGNLRWARNMVFSGGDTQESTIGIARTVRGSKGSSTINAFDDEALRETVQRAEALSLFSPLSPETYVDKPYTVYPHTQPKIWFDRTANLDATARAREARSLVEPAKDAGLWAAGYVQVAARGAAVRDMQILERYYPYTTAQYSVTVRHPKGIGSGWAGVDFNDWGRIDTAKLSAIALDKCLRSQNPVAVEPGRYTAILEPQAVCDMWAPIMDSMALDRYQAEQGNGPFAAGNGNSKIGEKLLDERITVSADPMDPDCGFVPFNWDGEPYRAVNWIEHGVLKELAYMRFYAISKLGHDRALPNSGAFHMSGGAVSIDEMVASTVRGIYVTRFNNISVQHLGSMLLNGNTRDGLWLIEHGKISKAIKNFRITESPLFMLNNLEQLGVPQRVFRPTAPAVCPPVKVRDFNFSGVMDAV